MAPIIMHHVASIAQFIDMIRNNLMSVWEFPQGEEPSSDAFRKGNAKDTNAIVCWIMEVDKPLSVTWDRSK